MTDEEFRKRVKTHIGDRPTKVWLSRLIARAINQRVDVIWGVGEEQGIENHELAREGDYFLMGQSVPEDILPQIIADFHEFCEGMAPSKKVTATRAAPKIKSAVQYKYSGRSLPFFLAWIPRVFHALTASRKHTSDTT